MKSPLPSEDGSEPSTPVEQQNVDYKETLQRLQAEFENYQKRTALEKEQFAQFANATLLKKLLVLLDTFEHALQALPSDASDVHTKGIHLLHQQFVTLLEGEGVQPLVTLDKPFDPYLHEVIRKIPSDKPEGVILDEIQKGYKCHNKILRHAKVVISSGGS